MCAPEVFFFGINDYESFNSVRQGITTICNCMAKTITMLTWTCIHTTPLPLCDFKQAA